MENYLKDLFKYLKAYETDYSKFETEAFFQTYNGIYTVFQALREQRNKAVEVDYFFLDRVRESPLNTSDLRELTVQVLITYFESEADIDGRSNQAYTHCRGARPIKQDVPFFEKHLIPILFKEGALKGNFQLDQFFLKEIARYLNKFGKALNTELTPEQFDAMPDPAKFLELERRRLQLGEDLLKDRESLEFHLARIDAFRKLGTKSRLLKQYLSEWGYLKKADFWSKVKGFFSVFFGKFKGAFSNTRFFRLVISQRNPAYLFYSLIIVIFIALAILVPSWWGSHTEQKLEDIRQNKEKVQRMAG